VHYRLDKGPGKHKRFIIKKKEPKSRGLARTFKINVAITTEVTGGKKGGQQRKAGILYKGQRGKVPDCRWTPAGAIVTKIDAVTFIPNRKKEG